MLDKTKPIKIIIFDGICLLCNDTVNFLHKRLRYRNYRFIASQSETGKEYLNQYDLNKVSLESIILIKDERIFVKSNALLQIVDDMSYKWSIFKIFRIVPIALRDWMYDLLSKYRHFIFGKTNSHNH